MCVYSLTKKQYYRAMKELSLKKLGVASTAALLAIVVGIVIQLINRSAATDNAISAILIIVGGIVLAICAVTFIIVNLRVKKSWKDLSDGEKITYYVTLKNHALTLEIEGYEPLKLGADDIKNVTSLKECYIISSKVFSFPVLKCEETEEITAMLKANNVRIK